jgi:hypothetical protein
MKYSSKWHWLFFRSRHAVEQLGHSTQLMT